MADEITHTLRLSLANGTLKDDNNPGKITVTQTTKTFFKSVVSIGTAEETVTFAELTTPGVAFLLNLDTTNYVQWGVSTGVYVGRLKGADIPACLRLDGSATTLYLKANTAACRVLITVYDA